MKYCRDAEIVVIQKGGGNKISSLWNKEQIKRALGFEGNSKNSFEGYVYKAVWTNVNYHSGAQTSAMAQSIYMNMGFLVADKYSLEQNGDNGKLIFNLLKIYCPFERI